MTDWDWADVAAVGVMAREWLSTVPGCDEPVASIVSELLEVWEGHGWDEGCYVVRQEECAAGIRYGFGCGPDHITAAEELEAVAWECRRPGATLVAVAQYCEELAKHLRGADSSGGCSGECRSLPLEKP